MPARKNYLIASLGVLSAFALIDFIAINRPDKKVYAQSSALLLPKSIATIPYILESEEYIGLVGAKARLSARYTFAARPDGSSLTATTTFTSEGGIHERERDLWLAGGIRAEISDHLSVVSAVKDLSPAADQMRSFRAWNPESDCSLTYDRSNSRKAGQTAEPILGFTTVKFVEDNATARITRWLAPQLGCTELRQLAEFKNTKGVVDNVSERRATRAESGKTDDALFTWPQTYNHVSPSERYLRAIDRCRCPRNDATLEALRKEDQRYQKQRFIN